jgi:hypothetical protein
MSAGAIIPTIPDYVAGFARSFSNDAGDELVESMLGLSEAAGDALREAINDVCHSHGIWRDTGPSSSEQEDGS